MVGRRGDPTRPLTKLVKPVLVFLSVSGRVSLEGFTSPEKRLLWFSSDLGVVMVSILRPRAAKLADCLRRGVKRRASAVCECCGGGGRAGELGGVALLVLMALMFWYRPWASNGDPMSSAELFSVTERRAWRCWWAYAESSRAPCWRSSEELDEDGNSPVGLR